jgi:hypothetical protein
LCALAFLVGCEEGDFEGFDGSLFPDEDAGAAGGSGGTAADDDAGTAGAGGAGGAAGGGTGGAGGSGGAGGAGGTGGGGPEASAFAGLLAEATCDALERCMGASLLADQLGGRDCVILHEGRFANGDLGYLVDSIEAGLVVYHADRVEQCIDDVGALRCDVKSVRLPASCEDALEGTVPLDGECTINADCAEEAFCDKGATASCPGTCTALQAASMPCHQNDDAQCEEGLVCFMGACDALGSESVACGSGLPGCMPGLECYDSGTGAECTASSAIHTELDGDDCDVVDGPLCQAPLVCESVSGTAGKCAETVSPGETCKRSVPNQCPVWQYCDAENAGEEGTCLDLPGNGDACLVRGSRKLCADEHVCVSDVCRPVNDNGGACATDAQCYGGDCGADGKCAAPLMCDAP